MSTEATKPDWSTKKVFTTGEAATICKVSQQTIIRCFDSGRLTGFRVPGSKFRRIPRDELLRFMRANGIPTSNIESGKRRVLIVDDDQAILELFQDIFAKQPQYEIRSASSGYDAGMLTESFRPHLILLDYMLPDINGNVVCRRIRENPELRETRIIVVSGAVDPSEVRALMDAGADDFIKKPFRVDALLARMGELLSEESANGT